MNQLKRRRLLIVDVELAPAVPEAEKRRLTIPELHMQTQQYVVEAANRYGYEIGSYDKFEGPIWKRIDLILKANSQVDAERLAQDAEEFGILSMSVWHKKVR